MCWKKYKMSEILWATADLAALKTKLKRFSLTDDTVWKIAEKDEPSTRVTLIKCDYDSIWKTVVMKSSWSAPDSCGQDMAKMWLDHHSYL